MYNKKNNEPIILKDTYSNSESDLVELVFLEDGVKGEWYHSGMNVYFNHIKFNGRLITDEEEVRKTLLRIN